MRATDRTGQIYGDHLGIDNKTDNAGVELLTGFGLATAAGLNAYIPLLALGLLARFTDLVTLPHA